MINICFVLARNTCVYVSRGFPARAEKKNERVACGSNVTCHVSESLHAM